MQFDPKTGDLTVSPNQLRAVDFLIRHALKHLRKTAGLSLDKYKREGRLTSHDSAAIAMVEIAERLGIRFEVKPHDHNELDLRDKPSL